MTKKREYALRTIAVSIHYECIVNKTIGAHHGWLINHLPSQVFGSYGESRTENSE